MSEAKRCRNMVHSYSDSSNEAYMAILKEEIPQEDLDGQAIYDSEIFKVEIKEGQVVDENFIAANRF